MLSCQRHLFSLPEEVHFLNCAYMSPLLKSVEEAGIAGLRRKSVPTTITPPDFFSGPEALRERFATLVNADPERVALIPATSYGVAIAQRNLELFAGQNVVIPAEEFPSDVYAWMEACEQSGAELRFVERPQDVAHPAQAWTEAILDAIDPGTAVVNLTACHWTDGTVFDLEEIGRKARQVQALYVVDGTQSIGARPFDYQRVKPDLLVCAGYKWLLGPYQLGFAVLGDRLIGGRPLEYNWLNREGSEDFSRLVDYTPRYAPGARRFDVGERSNLITVGMLDESIRQIQEWTVEAIEAYCDSLSAQLESTLGERGFIMSPRADRAAHMFGIRVPEPERVPKIMEDLRARNVWVSQRGDSIRVAPHVYTTQEDIDALVEGLLAAQR